MAETPTLAIRKLATRTPPWTERLAKSWQLWVMMLFPLTYLIIFKYVPMYGIIISFKDFDPVLGMSRSPWVGLRNFIRFAESYTFYRVVWNTISISIYTLVVAVPFPITLALLLNALPSQRYRKSVQMISYMPYFISTVVIAVSAQVCAEAAWTVP